ncbi:DUF881 domain-containing protein [Streptomyces sp. URMC 123]|uniref:DUF881 domain-containing protein n=1 Tax=Streptomyces sp. URMC 123 TaxID=3423403 RepID=UPI003F19BD75
MNNEPIEPMNHDENARPARPGREPEPPRPGRRPLPGERPGAPDAPEGGAGGRAGDRTPPEAAGPPEAAEPPRAAGLPETETEEAEAEAEAAGPPAAGAPMEGPAAGTPAKGPGEGPAQLTGRERLRAGLWPPRITRAQLTFAILLFVLGLGLAIQVRSTSDSGALRGARQEDLVRILDELDDRSQRLEDEKRRLEDQRRELETSSDQAEEARKQTVQREQQLGILAGTIAAQGPGITITVSDTAGKVTANKLLDAIQELRAAGAEAIQINDVRVVANTYFEDVGGGVRIDGKKVSQPFRFKVIGKPQDLEPALHIPGGVVQTLEKEQATVTVARAEKIIVDALRPGERPDYARSSSQ